MEEGVTTRARALALALQKDHAKNLLTIEGESKVSAKNQDPRHVLTDNKPSTRSKATAKSTVMNSHESYMELRSRRLEKLSSITTREPKNEVKLVVVELHSCLMMVKKPERKGKKERKAKKKGDHLPSCKLHRDNGVKDGEGDSDGDGGGHGHGDGYDDDSNDDGDGLHDDDGLQQEDDDDYGDGEKLHPDDCDGDRLRHDDGERLHRDDCDGDRLRHDDGDGNGDRSHHDDGDGDRLKHGDGDDRVRLHDDDTDGVRLYEDDGVGLREDQDSDDGDRLHHDNDGDCDAQEWARRHHDEHHHESDNSACRVGSSSIRRRTRRAATCTPRESSSNSACAAAVDESATMGPRNKGNDSRQGRRGGRECTPADSDSDVRSVNPAHGSTSTSRKCCRAQMRSISAPPFDRGNGGPSPAEIEAFFRSAEQQERMKFIQRYNFDPANGRPLRGGRYEWTRL